MNMLEYIGAASNVATIFALIVAILSISYQVKSFTATKVKISNDVAEWETATDQSTGEIIEEIIVLKCINEGYIPTAIESARFEIQFFDEEGKWNVMDIVGADMETQLSMPIRIDAAGTARLRFVFDKQRSAKARENRLVYIQRTMREQEEMRREVSLSNRNFMFMREKAA